MDFTGSHLEEQINENLNRILISIYNNGVYNVVS